MLRPVLASALVASFASSSLLCCGRLNYEDLGVIAAGGSRDSTADATAPVAASASGGAGSRPAQGPPDAGPLGAGPPDAGPPDAAPPDEGPPEAPPTGLVHRYSFEQAGTIVLDSIGGADARFVGGALDGVSGAAVFEGNGEYVDLPNSLLSVYTSVTLEVWLVWEPVDPGSSWQRIFDFGSNEQPEGEQGTGLDTHLFVTPRSSGPTGSLHLSYRGNSTDVFALNTSAPLSQGEPHQVVAVVDGVAHEMLLHLDGFPLASRALNFELSRVQDVNAWLGRSQRAGDPEFEGSIFEFRIYDGALDAAQVRLSYAAGPDAEL